VRHARSLAEVAGQGLCSGCGLCAGLVPDLIHMSMSREGYLRPRFSGPLGTALDRRLLAVCPGDRQEPSPTDAPHCDLVWGPYHRVVSAYARDEELRFKASSGGMISAVCLHLLETGRVDFVLQIKPDPRAPLRSIAHASRSREEIVASASARYGPAAPLAGITALLDRGERFAVVGKPCDISGLRNLARSDPRVDVLVPYKIAFFCAGVSSLRTSERIAGKYGLSPEDVAMLRYRGHGCPGPTRIVAKDGRVFEQTYEATWSEELNQEIQFRCKICPDAIGEQADIVCGDAWVGADGYPYAEHEGWNVVVCRSRAGDHLLAEMEIEGSIVVKPLHARDLDRIQPHQKERKEEMLARLAGLALAGGPVPRYRGLRVWSAALPSWRGFARTAFGTYRRARRDASREDGGAGARSEAAPLGAYGLLGPSLLFMAAGLGLPLLVLAAFSLWTQDYLTIDRTPTLANYTRAFSSPLYVWLVAKSTLIALAVTAAVLALAYPIAYFVAFHAGRLRALWLVAVTVPFWTSYLLRIFAWKVILGYNGLINSGLMELGLITVPLNFLLYTPFAVVVTLTHAWVPFAILPIYVSLSKIHQELIEAAADLGGNACQRFTTVILPLSMPGVLSAALLVFIPTAGDYVTPALVGGSSGAMIGNIIQAQFGRANDWPLGAALSIVLMITVTFVALLAERALRLRPART
jgi:coenzyme F420 hydrogenase subunit beta